MISVCMATYNGEEYIEEQLLSIYRQSRQPDEVVICDDGSKDATIEIIRDFIGNYELSDNWTLYQNKENKGYPGNFYYAMSLCRGDVVFLADQDDIWHWEKIARMYEVLEKDPYIEVLACKFGLINEEGKNIHAVMSSPHAKGTGTLRKITIHDFFYKYEWPGMVIAYRKKWYDERYAMESCKEIPHDFFLCAKAAEEECFVQMDQELASHRRHGNNTGKEEHRLSRLLNKERKLWEIDKYLKTLYYSEQGGILQTEDGKRALARKIASQQGRRKALQSGKIIEVLKEAWRNRREVWIASVVCDVLIVRQEKR